MTTSTQEGEGDAKQGGLWDFSIVDQQLAEACATIDKNATAIKATNAAKRLRKEKIAAMQTRIEDEPGFDEGGVRIRVRKDDDDPGYVINVGPRAGGGFEVKEWHSVGVKSQGRVE